VPRAKKSRLISNMDNKDDCCVKDSCRFMVRMPFDLRQDLRGSSSTSIKTGTNICAAKSVSLDPVGKVDESNPTIFLRNRISVITLLRTSGGRM